MSPTVPSDKAWQRIRRAVQTVESQASTEIGTTRRRPVPENAPIRAISY